MAEELEYVNPIRDVHLIQRIKQVLRKRSGRDYLLFLFGINTGIRIQDLLRLKVRDVWDGKEVVEFLTLRNQTFYLNENVKQAIKYYLTVRNLSMNDYLFKSRKYDKPITRQQAYRIINSAAKEVGIQERIGTHTIRKTFGYHAYQKGIAISLIQSVYGHSSTTETLRYIGIDKQDRQPIKIDVNL